jgi:hypothetical protein
MSWQGTEFLLKETDRLEKSNNELLHERDDLKAQVGELKTCIEEFIDAVQCDKWIPNELLKRGKRLTNWKVSNL